VTPLPSDEWGPGLVRQRVRVAHSGSGLAEELWIGVPGYLLKEAPRSGNPWAVGLLPLAMTVGEDLDVRLPVCPELRSNLMQLQAIWRSWYPSLHSVRIDGEQADAEGEASNRRTGLFYSGGVDSAYSLARCLDAGAAVPDLLMVWGADVALSKREVFSEMLARYERLAEHYGTMLLPLATNLRETSWGRTDWLGLAHGALFAACGLAVGPRYSTLALASSDNSYSPCSPLGSHPGTDPLFSTARTAFLHDVADTRVAKCAALGGHRQLLATLRVCWETQTGQNCGRCEKCLRTMMALELVGLLPSCDLFPASTVDVRWLRRLRISPQMYERRYLHTMERARAVGRQDFVGAIEAALARSKRLARIEHMVAPLRRRRLLWRIPEIVERVIGRRESGEAR